MPTRAPVTAIIPVRNPDRDHLAQTLSSLARQTRPPTEVIVVDSTPGGFKVKSQRGGGCGLCGDPVVTALDILSQKGVDVSTIQIEAGTGEARRRGMDAASQPFVLHIDEDAVFKRENAIEAGLQQLRDDNEAVAVGGSVTPLRGNPDGHVFALAERALPSTLTIHHLMHPRAFCSSQDSCMFIGQHRGEDITLRRHLQQHGTIVAVPQMTAQKDLPTQRQSTLRNIGLAVAGGAAAPLAERAISGLLARASEVV